MKLAVILGVTHILFGIILKGVNAVFFNSKVDFFFEFIPQLIFMLSLFGYMDFMIIFKWLNVYESAEAPSIINNMINLFLSPTRIVLA